MANDEVLERLSVTLDKWKPSTCYLLPFLVSRFFFSNFHLCRDSDLPGAIEHLPASCHASQVDAFTIRKKKSGSACILFTACDDARKEKGGWAEKDKETECSSNPRRGVAHSDFIPLH